MHRREIRAEVIAGELEITGPEDALTDRALAVIKKHKQSLKLKT
jgi:hypothetical protein